jgi:hypothetical protein
MVCLCGRIISNKLDTLLDHGSRTLPYCNWASIRTAALYDDINSYNTFRSMVESLCKDRAKAAVQLLRAKFAGYLDDVILQHSDEAIADFLTAEGVLLRPSAALCYRMASPLIDGLIRQQVIPIQFPDAPWIVPPCRSQSTDLCVMQTLIQSLKFFDKDLIYLASTRLYKKANVPVGRVSSATVPRESVYDTELMRVFTNWLGKRHGWSVTGQWHLRSTDGKDKYTDIILKKDSNPPIVLELLATGDSKTVRPHIEKTPDYIALLSAKEGWVVHFTREDEAI